MSTIVRMTVVGILAMLATTGCATVTGPAVGDPGAGRATNGQASPRGDAAGIKWCSGGTTYNRATDLCLSPGGP
jgi:hypothetical protein